MKILAIDDVAGNLVSLSALLRTYLPGCETETASTGLEGIEKARSFQPDAILLDIQMPGMDGYEVCKALKGESSTGHIPVIFLTAQSTDSVSRIRALEIGGDAFLAKPVDPAELTAQVRAMLRKKQAEDNVTGRKRVEDALRESEERFRTLVETAPEAIFIQTGGKIVYVNGAAQRLFGAADSSELVGRSIEERIHPGSLAQVRARIQVLNEKRKRLPLVDETFLRLDDSPVDVAVSAVPFVFEGEVGALVFASDITERKEAEAALREQLDELRRWHEATLGREMRILELKREVNELLAETGRPRRYSSVTPDDGPGIS